MKKSGGLTLIELAIVLVVIGILLGLGAGLLSVLIKRLKYNESKEIINAGVEAIIGYAVSTGHLPHSANLSSVVRSIKDSYGKDIAYVYDNDLADQNLTSLCGLTSTNLTVRVCSDASCTSSNDISNVAFILISGDGNYNNQTHGTQNVTSPTTVNIYPFGAEVDNFQVAGDDDPDRVEGYDDIVKWVALHEIQSAQGCETLTIISPPTLPPAVEDQPYTYQLKAKGGKPGYTWTLVSGSLGGLNLSSDGLISGTVNLNSGLDTGELPSCTGTISFTAQVQDSEGQTRTGNFTIPVRARDVEIITDSLPDAYEGTAYSASLSSIGGSGTYTYSLVSGSLPPGLTLDPGGQITGTPPSDSGCSEDVYSFSVRVSSCTTYTRGFSIKVRDPDCGGGGSGGGGGLSCTLSANPSTVNPGDSTILSWNITGGPADGTFTPSSGTCTSFTNSTGGSCTTGPITCPTTFTLSISNGSSTSYCSASVNVNLPPLQVSPPSGTTFTFYVGQPASGSIVVSGGSPPYTNTSCYQSTCGSLGISFSCSSSGANFSGTPTKVGSCNVSATWEDSCNQSVSASYTVNVVCSSYTVYVIKSSYSGSDYVNRIEIDGNCNSISNPRAVYSFTASSDQTVKLYRWSCSGTPDEQFQLSSIDSNGDCVVYISCNGDADDCKSYDQPYVYCPTARFRSRGGAEGLRINGGACDDNPPPTGYPATVEVYTDDDCNNYACNYGFNGTFQTSEDTDFDCRVRIDENCALSNW